MARAKNTQRAEARRRHREQTRVNTLSDELSDPQPVAPVASTRSSLLRIPNVREDIRALPGMFRTKRLLWLPFGLLVLAFFVALFLDRGYVPQGIDSIAGVFVQLVLPPTALFIFFIGGFLAPRASYLVGALLGLLDGLLWTLRFALLPADVVTDPTGQGRIIAITDVFAIMLIAVFVGILAAGFAAWYRNFLRSSQERARQNRANQQQAQAAKAKEQARLDKQAARDAKKAPPAQKPTA